jgi:hypothetical protein
MRLSGTFLALIVSACASAPSTPLDKRALAERLVDLQYTPETMRVMARSYVDEYLFRLPDYNAACPVAGEHVAPCNAMAGDIEADIRIALERAIVWTDQLYPGMVEDQVDMMVDLYTAEELTAAIAFNESPEGRSMQAKTPAADARATAAAYVRLRPWIDLLGSQVDQIHEEYASEFEMMLEE